MKRIVLGDPHGRYEYVKQIYDKEQPNEVIILGDYFDSFNILPEDQRDSYDNIIKLRKEHLSKHKGRFDLLIGNHDFHYMDENFGRCSGWNTSTCSLAMFRLLRDYDAGILKFIYIDEVNKTIYSHAGVSMNWFNTWIKSKNLADINTIDTKAFYFTYREGGDYYGSSSYNGPLWIRPEGLKKSMYVDNNGIVWSQVFGHTEPDTPIHWESNGADFYGIDCIYKHYLIENIDDNGKLISRKLGDVIG